MCIKSPAEMRGFLVLLFAVICEKMVQFAVHFIAKNMQNNDKKNSMMFLRMKERKGSSGLSVKSSTCSRNSSFSTLSRF